MRSIELNKKWQLFLLIIFTPSIASANAGVPMLAVFTPILVLSLIPIIVIETLYLAKKLHLTWKKALKNTTLTNLFSTCIGIPITWFALVIIQIILGGDGAFGMDTMIDKILSVTLQAAWLIPYEKELNWMIPLASLVLLVPFFFASWLSEYWLSTKLLVDISKDILKRQIRNANLITYALLTFWPLGLFMMLGANKL